MKNKKLSKKMQRAFNKLVRQIMQEVTPEMATSLLKHFAGFLEFGGKRPIVHGFNSRMIVPMSEEFVPCLEEIAGFRISMFDGEFTRRQLLRIVRAERHLTYMRSKAARTFGELMLQIERIEAKNSIVADTPVEQKLQPIVEEVVSNNAESFSVAMSMYGKTDVLAKGSTALVFFEGRSVPKNREVFMITDDQAVSKELGGIWRWSVEKLVEKGWKWMELKEFPAIIGHLAQQYERLAA